MSSPARKSRTPSPSTPVADGRLEAQVRILAESRMTDVATPEALAATLAQEIAVGKRLYAQGVILQAYVDIDMRRTFMIVEAESVDAARELFAEYPQVRQGLIAFEFTPLAGMPAVAAVHRENGTPIPAWWPPS